MLVLLLVQLHVSPAYFIGQIILQERHVSRAAIGKLYSNINDPRATQPPADIDVRMISTRTKVIKAP